MCCPFIFAPTPTHHEQMRTVIENLLRKTEIPRFSPVFFYFYLNIPKPIQIKATLINVTPIDLG